MANLFFNIPVVTGTVGAPVDISGMGAEKTIVVSGPLTGAVILEISEDAGTTWAQIFSFTKTGKKTLSFAANRLRARSSGGGGAIINVGANDWAGLFTAVPMPAANGLGASVDISTFGALATAVVQGPFSGAIGIQVSTDGVQFAEYATFTKGGPGWATATMIGDFVRAVSRGASGVLPYAPVISFGAINDCCPQNQGQ